MVKLKTKLFMLAAVFIVFCSRLFAAADAPKQNKNLLKSCSETGTIIYWDSLSGSGVLEKNGHQISFRIDDPAVLFDFNKVSFTDAPVIRDGAVMVSPDFLAVTEKFFQSQNSENKYRIGAILVDPGHGGKDPGAMRTQVIDGKKVTLKEKDITLKVGKMLYNHLKTSYPDKQVLITRTDDRFLSLAERTDMANSIKLKPNEAVIYISVHVNASLSPNASGYEVWYLSPNYRREVLDTPSSSEDKELLPILNSMMEEEYTTESILIAKFIMDGLKVQIGNDSKARGIRAEEWFVVKNAKMPSVLVEMGFLSNYKEACLLNDDAYLQKISQGLYNGITAFVTHFERSRGFTGR
ncbi:MAG: N-acetylmuramoyl-L-alanine amidase [Treponema sp.]|jgi:N-acetylmuramoyl-L-alanine amidase|nr:N-acetylmuramoyl-L-alanine amidase [Treponema sp.]